jgi:hypothetical protein
MYFPVCKQQKTAAVFLEGKQNIVNAAYMGQLDVIAAHLAMGDDVNQSNKAVVGG